MRRFGKKGAQSFPGSAGALGAKCFVCLKNTNYSQQAAQRKYAAAKCTAYGRHGSLHDWQPSWLDICLATSTSVYSRMSPNSKRASCAPLIPHRKTKLWAAALQPPRVVLSAYTADVDVPHPLVQPQSQVVLHHPWLKKPEAARSSYRTLTDVHRLSPSLPAGEFLRCKRVQLTLLLRDQQIVQILRPTPLRYFRKSHRR